MTSDNPVKAEAPAKRGRRKNVAEVPDPAETARAESVAEQGMAAMSPDALARALRAVAAELERDPALARRVASAVSGEPKSGYDSPPPSPRTRIVAEAAEGAAVDEEPVATIGRTFRPTIVTGITSDLGSGVPDPFALRERLGLDGLREALESLRLGSLRAIVREYKLDPGGRLSKLNDAEKLRERIVRAAMERE